MGHKTHPLGFRLGITQPYRSFWYSKLNLYSDFIKEDYLLRNVIYDYWKNQGIKFKYEYSGISTIFIYRHTNENKINLEIETTSPGLLVGKSGAGLASMDRSFTKMLPNTITRMNIIEIKEPFDKADILAEELVRQLQLRMPFRRAMKLLLEGAQSKQVKGIKVQVSGRLNGADIARTEWLRQGRVPLQTLRANIDYSYQTAQTIYGILGIKIWLFKGEVFSS